MQALRNILEYYWVFLRMYVIVPVRHLHSLNVLCLWTNVDKSYTKYVMIAIQERFFLEIRKNR